MSSIYVTGLSYVDISGAGSSININTTSPTGLTINRNQGVFVSGATSNRSTVVVENSSITGDDNDLLLGGNVTFVGDLGTDPLSRDANSLGKVRTSASGNTDVITDFNVSLGDGIGIATNKNLLNNFLYTSFNSIGNDQLNTSIQQQNSFLGGSNLFNF